MKTVTLHVAVRRAGPLFSKRVPFVRAGRNLDVEFARTQFRDALRSAGDALADLQRLGASPKGPGLMAVLRKMRCELGEEACRPGAKASA